MIEELYHQQKLTLGILKREDTQLQQMRALYMSQHKEKKGEKIEKL